MPVPSGPSPKDELRRDLSRVLNIHGVDSLANTPDFVLAGYLTDCLAAYVETKERNDEWHGGPNRTIERLMAAQQGELDELRRQAADELSREGQEMGLDTDPHTATHTPVYMWLYNGCLIRIRYHPVSGKRQYVQTPSKDLQGLILDEVPAGASQLYLRNVGRPAEEVAMGLDQ